MRRLALALLIAFGGCRSPSPTESPPEDSATSGDLRDWGDLERYHGQRVTVEGDFDHIQGQHGVVKLDSGLVVYVPEIHLFLREQAWFDHIHKRVRVRGLLRTYSKPIPGYAGPSIDIDHFRVLQP